VQGAQQRQFRNFGERRHDFDKASEQGGTGLSKRIKKGFVTNVLKKSYKKRGTLGRAPPKFELPRARKTPQNGNFTGTKKPINEEVTALQRRGGGSKRKTGRS